MVGAAQDSVSSPLYNYFEENALYLDEENSNVEYFDIMHKYC